MQPASYTHHHSTLARFILLFAFLYAAFGVNSPFFPSFLSARGLEPEAIAVVLAAGTAIRLVAAPLAGRIADRLDASRAVLAASIAGAAGLDHSDDPRGWFQWYCRYWRGRRTCTGHMTAGSCEGPDTRRAVVGGHGRGPPALDIDATSTPSASRTARSARSLTRRSTPSAHVVDREAPIPQLRQLVEHHVGPVTLAEIDPQGCEAPECLQSPSSRHPPAGTPKGGGPRADLVDAAMVPASVPIRQD